MGSEMVGGALTRLSLAVGAALLLVTAGAGLGSAPAMTPEQVLTRVVETYGKAQDYRGLSRSRIVMDMGYMKVTTETQATELLFKRPNQLRAVVPGLAFGGPEVICDGVTMWIWLPAQHKYQKQAAPPDLLERWSSVMGGMPPIPGVLGAAQLLQAQDLRAGLQGARFVTPEEVNGRKVYALELTFSSGVTTDLWVDRADYRVWRATSWVDYGKAMEAMMGAPSGAEGASPEQAAGEALMGAMAGMKMSVLETFSAVEINRGIEDSAFSFTPPEGAQEAANLMGGMFGPSEGPGAPPEGGSALVGQPVPELKAKDAAGALVQLSDLRGSPVLLDMWASWCGPCQQELPEIQQIHEKYAQQGLKVITINVWEQERSAGEVVIQEKQYTFPVLFPTDAELKQIEQDFKLEAIPRVLLIDREGIVRGDLTGLGGPGQLERELEKIGISVG